MSVCERCWTAASYAAAVLGGSTVDHYHRLLAENESEHTDD